MNKPQDMSALVLPTPVQPGLAHMLTTFPTKPITIPASSNTTPHQRIV